MLTVAALFSDISWPADRGSDAQLLPVIATACNFCALAVLEQSLGTVQQQLKPYF